MRIWLSRPHMSGRELDYVHQAFDSNFIAPMGPQLDQFQAVVAEYLGDNTHCVALSSGSAALHLALRICGAGAGDEVWVSSMTFAGGVFPILYENATPVFVDLSPDHWTIDPDLLAEALAEANRNNRLPKAIIPTDLYGQSCDLARLEPLAEKYGVKLIVDSAESLGAAYADGRKCGTGGDASILSFNGNKIITTSGGGMLCTKDKKLAEQAIFFATQARDSAPHYQHSTYGYNYRMSNISAAIGLGQMEVLDQRVARRREIFQNYQQRLNVPGVGFMPEPDGWHSSHWLSVITIDPRICGITREDVRLVLLEKEIESRPLWKPMHLQPLFTGTRYIGEGFDTGLFDTGLCLPSGSDMTEDEQDEVIERILVELR
ncbi:MAG: DegT/DnrJ/EryC1/StrS family aminotransferase [Parasphingorhabdus sp.]|uniref:DegT/DnrJ/EryC1/StrS family aminotransferase n=1 Tax=Parasphingorhabdus sp. TaxID=2709688 RepID=UPI0030010F9C